MSIVLNPFSEPARWLEHFEELLPDETFVLWPDVGDTGEVDLAIAWVLPRADVRSYSNLRAILSLGAGAEQWLREGMPAVDVVRLADPGMSDEMATYALHWVIHLQRGFDRTDDLQRAGRWEIPESLAAADYPVGILGYGTIGARVGRAFADLGYPVNAWSRSGGVDDGVTHFAGLDELDAFLAASMAVVNVLPSTPATAGLLTARRFARFATGSVFVNMGRGTVIADEADLIAALDHGPLAAAALDVTDPEPPVEGSPLYTHPSVHLTAHLAGATRVSTAARLVADNVRRIRSGDEPFPLLDRSRGY